MTKSEILTILQNYKTEYFEKYGILDIGIFGSTARNEAQEESDVDVVIKLQKPELFMLVGIKQELESRFNRPVDIVTYRERMNPFLKKRIDREAVYVW